jgi:NAD(P)-dependent dehydrogenase (short-subunit alcohol dehydrogenase family)
VTGGASGIGAAICRVLAAAGARGAVLDLAGAAEPEFWLSVTADVRDEASLGEAFGHVRADLPAADVLVAAAGIVPPWRTLDTLDLEEWDEVFRVNVRGMAATFTHALPGLADGASIVAIASLNAWKGDPNIASYVASKHAVLGLVRSAALDLGPRGIRVNAIAPGPIATEALLARMRRREAERGTPVSDALAAAAGATALARIATVDEVAGAALFLASDLSSGVTGQLLAVDGGVL